MEDDLQWKTTSNIKSDIAQQLVGSFPNFKLNLTYLSNQWLGFPQILNFSLCDESKLYKYVKWRRTPLKDNLKY